MPQNNFFQTDEQDEAFEQGLRAYKKKTGSPRERLRSELINVALNYYFGRELNVDYPLHSNFPMRSIAKSVKAWRKKRMMSQKELAESAGLSMSTISDIENMRHESVSPSTLSKIAQALNVKPEQIYPSS